MLNPVRSEADAFKLVVIIGAGAAAVIALSLLAGPEFGVVLAAGLVGFGLGHSWRSIRDELRTDRGADDATSSSRPTRPGSPPGP